MNTTTIIGAGALTTAATSAIVKEDGTIDKSKRNGIIGSTLSLTATTVIGGSINDATMRQIHNKYASAYIDSLSDEELVSALQKLDLLESEAIDVNISKTV